MVNIQSIRFLVKIREEYFSYFKVAVSKNDASIYLFPYAKTGRYYSGLCKLPEVYSSRGKREVKVDYAEQLSAEKMPKLSIHETGQIHVDLDKDRIGPLKLPDLQNIRDQHIASVSIDNLSSLPKHTTTPHTNPPHIDFIINLEGDVKSLRTLVYLNGLENRFSKKCVVLQIGTKNRNHLKSPIYFGFFPIAQSDLSVGEERNRPGIVAISGWDVSKPIGTENDFLFIRGE